MRKKCLSCGLICFLNEASCKRCGADRLEIISAAPENDLAPAALKTPKNSAASYLVCFVLAVGIEFVALVVTVPAWGGIGMHSGGAQASTTQIVAAVLFLVLHIPSLLINLTLMIILSSDIFFFLMPLTQIAFWTYLLARLNRRRLLRKRQPA